MKNHIRSNHAFDPYHSKKTDSSWSSVFPSSFPGYEDNSSNKISMPYIYSNEMQICLLRAVQFSSNYLMPMFYVYLCIYMACLHVQTCYLIIILFLLPLGSYFVSAERERRSCSGTSQVCVDNELHAFITKIKGVISMLMQAGGLS